MTTSLPGAAGLVSTRLRIAAALAICSESLGPDIDIVPLVEGRAAGFDRRRFMFIVEYPSSDNGDP